MALINVLLMNFEKAESFLTNGIKLGPHVAYNYGLRAYVRIRLDNFAGAISDCSSKLELKPKDASIYALRGWALYCQEDYASAISDLSRAFELNPKRVRDYQDSLRLVDCYQREGLDGEAIEFCTNVLELKVEPFYQLELYGRRSVSLYRLKRLDDCLADLDKAIKYAGLSDKAELHKMKADVLNESGQEEDANIQLDIYQGLKQFEAQITEWVPASIFKRVVAQLIDGVALGIAVALLFSTGIAICWIFKIGHLDSLEIMVSLLIPCGIALFFLTFLDSLFICVIPVTLILCLLELAGNDGQVVTILLSTPQLIFLILLILIGLLNFTYHVWFPSSLYQATPGKLVMKIKLTSIEGGRMQLGPLVCRHVLRALESLFILTLLYFCLFYLFVSSSLPLKLIVAFLLVPFLAVATLGSIKPGLHNSLPSGFVSDVSMFFDKQIRNFRDN